MFYCFNVNLEEEEKSNFVDTHVFGSCKNR